MRERMKLVFRRSDSAGRRSVIPIWIELSRLTRCKSRFVQTSSGFVGRASSASAYTVVVAGSGWMARLFHIFSASILRDC